MKRRTSWQVRGQVSRLAAVAITVALIGPTAPNVAYGAEAPAIAPAADAVQPSSPESIASQTAQSTGQPVTVDALTTETGQTVANPDGSFTYTGATAPIRVQRNGAWTPVSSDLTQNADGTWSPAAVPGSLVFGNAGSTTLATMTDESGHSVSFSWPSPLPAPTVSGDTAVYPSVWPGIDLSVSAAPTGAFEDTLVVHNSSAEAAAAPLLAAMHLGVTASAGLTVSADPAGNTKVNDAAGHTVFAFGTPEMWDSAAPAPGSAAATAPAPSDGTASDVHHPGPGAHRGLMKASTAGSTVTISADPTTLNGSSPPVYPVYLDPVIAPSATASAWDEVQQAYPTVSNYNNSSVEDLGVGYQGFSCPCGNERAYFSASLSSQAMNSDKITAASVITVQDYAGNTGSGYATGITLANSNPIGSSTTWNNQPSYSAITTVTDPAGSNNGVTFDITSYANNTLRVNHTTAWSFMLYNANEGSSNYFKRFAHNPTVSITYEKYPTLANYSVNPTPFQTTGASGTCPYSDGGYLTHQSGAGFTPRVQVNSTTNPQNTLGANFWLYNNTTATYVTGWNKLPVPAGVTGTYVSPSPATGLVDGDNYSWWADAYDLTLENTGETSAKCNFTVDTSAPTLLNVSSVDFPAAGSGTLNKGVNTSGSFTISATDATSGVWCFEYAIDGYLATSSTPCNTTGNLKAPGGPWSAGSVSSTVTWGGSAAWGTHFLTAIAVDQAGNRTQAFTYRFFLADKANTAAVAGDVTGDGSPDLLAVDGSGNLKSFTQTADPSASNVTVADNAQGPGSGGSWAGTLLAHRGTVSGTVWDDLWAWTPSNPAQLYLYPNDSPTLGKFVKSSSLPMSRPDCSANASDNNLNSLDASFPCYQAVYQTTGLNNYAADWHNVLQMASLGIIKNIGADNNASLVTIESDGNGGANLWLYPATSSKVLGYPFLLSTSATANWANFDLASPGDVTGDGVPDLWVRDRTTGKVYTLPITIGTMTVTNTSGTIPAPIAGTMAYTGTTLNAAVYPQIVSAGDIDGSGHADLYAASLYGDSLFEFPGTGSGTGVTSGFGTPVTVTSTDWSKNITAMEGSIRIPTVGALQLTAITGPKCLDDASGGSANGTVIQVYGCNHTFPQTWNLNSDQTIRPGFAPTKCVEVATNNGSTVDNASNIELSDCTTGATQQQWVLRPDTSIFNPASGRCLADPGGSTTNGTQFQILDCGTVSGGIDSDTAQQWTAPASAATPAPATLWQANDTGSVASDTMSNHNLALHGTVTRPAGFTGLTGDTALGFTGTGSYGDAGAALVNTSGPYTVSAWVNLTSTANGTQAIISQDGANVSGLNLQYDSGNNRWELATVASDSTTATVTRAVSPAAPQTGTWTMVTGVYDQANSVLKLYINGAFVANVWPAPGAFSAPNHTVVGRNLAAGAQAGFFVGSIDNARVYTSALTDAQVAALYVTRS